MSLKSTIKKLLPSKVSAQITKLRLAQQQALIKYIPANRLMASIYYFLFSSAFRREHVSVIAGKKQHQKNLGVSQNSNAVLRRNTHRLEKGLIMRPRKPVFAESYIEETVAAYQVSLAQANFDLDELKWAEHVLAKYFEVVEASPIIMRCKQTFNALPVLSKDEVKSSIPYKHENRVVADISSEQLHNLFKQRRSIRWFEEKKVPMDVIEQAINMASQAPSACNRQPFNFYTITDPKKASEIAAIPMGTKGFAQNIQALIVVVGDLSYYPKERDRHVIYIDGGLVSMQLMLAFESLGLSTCPINWPDMEAYEKKMEQALNIEKYQRPIMLMAVGYGDPEGEIPFSQKKSAQQLIKVVK